MKARLIGGEYYNESLEFKGYTTYYNSVMSNGEILISYDIDSVYKVPKLPHKIHLIRSSQSFRITSRDQDHVVQITWYRSRGTDHVVHNAR